MPVLLRLYIKEVQRSISLDTLPMLGRDRVTSAI